MSKKKSLGQFFTTNYDYILTNMFIPLNTRNIIEPFAGNKDLLSFVKNKEQYNIELYDIDPLYQDITKQDTLLNPVDLNNKFSITNPPYLARNKTKSKEIYDKYDVNDLYKCYIKQIIESKNHLGGIIIIPLNFFSSIRKSDIYLRKDFIKKYNIDILNIFEEKVFDDTSYTVCSFQYSKIKDNKKDEINGNIYRNGKLSQTISFALKKKNNYTIGGELYNLKHNNNYTITRLTKNNEKNTNLLVKCIDDSEKNKICMKFVKDNEIFVDDTPKSSARTYATLIINPPISEEQQKELAKKFNDFLEEKRKKYNSLFLSNYRESKDIARKRISFDLVYDITKHLLDK